mgnify:FL=1
MMTTKGKKGLSNYLRSLETTEKKECYVSDVAVAVHDKCKGEEGSPTCAMCRKGKNYAGIVG